MSLLLDWLGKTGGKKHDSNRTKGKKTDLESSMSESERLRLMSQPSKREHELGKRRKTYVPRLKTPMHPTSDQGG